MVASQDVRRAVREDGADGESALNKSMNFRWPLTGTSHRCRPPRGSSRTAPELIDVMRKPELRVTVLHAEPL